MAKKRKAKPVAKHPAAPASDKLISTYQLLCGGIDSVNSLALLYDKATAKRGPGAPTHEEQDLLRSMVVMAGATLDATTKRMVKDTLQDVVLRVPESLKKAREFVQRQILNTLSTTGGEKLAEALLHDSPRWKVIEFLIDEITGDSLQSVEQLMRASAFMGVTLEAAPLRQAFEARNQIIHEMDAVLGGGKKRRQRRKPQMRGFAQQLLGAAAELLARTDERLASR